MKKLEESQSAARRDFCEWCWKLIIQLSGTFPTVSRVSDLKKNLIVLELLVSL